MIERLEEIRAHAARWAEGDLKNPTTTSVFRHRAELLAEVDRLNERAERAEQTIANSAEIITARDKQIRELNAIITDAEDTCSCMAVYAAKAKIGDSR